MRHEQRFYYLINAYPLSLKIRISWMEPKCANVFCSSSSERPLAMPPQYTVQLVGLDWLYTSSKVKGLELAGIVKEHFYCSGCRQWNLGQIWWHYYYSCVVRLGGKTNVFVMAKAFMPAVVLVVASAAIALFPNSVCFMRRVEKSWVPLSAIWGKHTFDIALFLDLRFLIIRDLPQRHKFASKQEAMQFLAKFYLRSCSNFWKRDLLSKPDERGCRRNIPVIFMCCACIFKSEQYQILLFYAALQLASNVKSFEATSSSFHTQYISRRGTCNFVLLLHTEDCCYCSKVWRASRTQPWPFLQRHFTLCPRKKKKLKQQQQPKSQAIFAYGSTAFLY